MIDMLAETVISDFAYFMMLVCCCVLLVSVGAFIIDWLLMEPRRTWGRIEKTVDDIQYDVRRIIEKVKKFEKELS